MLQFMSSSDGWGNITMVGLFALAMDAEAGAYLPQEVVARMPGLVTPDPGRGCVLEDWGRVCEVMVVSFG